MGRVDPSKACPYATGARNSKSKVEVEGVYILASAPSGGRRPGTLWTKGVQRPAHAFWRKPINAFQSCVGAYPRAENDTPEADASLNRSSQAYSGTKVQRSSTIPHRYACVILITRMSTALGMLSPVSESSRLLRSIVHPQPRLRTSAPSETANGDIAGTNSTVHD